MSNFIKNSGCLSTILGILLGLVIVAACALVFAWPAMLLWNAILPALFKCSTITYWQMVGLNVLIGLTFGRETNHVSK